MRVIAKYKYGNEEGYANLVGTRMSEKDSMVYVYNGDRLIGMFDIGCLVMIYLTESSK